jgi:LacI family transcriptional regulator
MAAEHLLDRGFEQFAYYGLRGVFYARACLQGFRERIEQHGGQCAVYEDESTSGAERPWQHDHEALARWLKSLQRPVGLMASHDPRAVMVVQTCRRVGLRVPEDVAVIGFNNDRQRCEFCEPPLSSVARPGEKIGFEAAALLDRLMHGQRAPQQDILFPPEGVVERGSTNTMAVEDNIPLAEALRFIHQNLAQRIGVEDILKHISVSRRWLEMAFKKKLRTTPHVYISQARVKKARTLLDEAARLRFKQVALDCGFSSTRQLNLIFQRFTGMSLRDYTAKVHAPHKR